MEAFARIRSLLVELEDQLKKLDAMTADKKNEYLRLQERIDEERNMCDQIIFEKGNLEQILNQCSVDVCRYKNEFEVIRERYAKDLARKVVHENFHFFLCYREEYHGKGAEAVVASHQAIIEKYGYCWWGKFAKERQKGGQYRSLEPFGESIRAKDGAVVTSSIREKFGARRARGQPVYLYLCNPNPPHIRLYVCNVVDFYYGEGKLPYQDKEGHIPPECGYVPPYYFYRREGHCPTCKGIHDKECIPRFVCNFWFKIDRMKEMEEPHEQFANLVNCFTQDSINFAIPILYPLLVLQKIETIHFEEMVTVRLPDNDFTVDIPRPEKGHTKVEEVTAFLSTLNKACGECFVRAELCGNPPGFSGTPRVQKSGEPDCIYLYLPADYRRDGFGCKFRILLDRRTTPEQKVKIENRIAVFLS
jgi:hypothetical protein